MRIPSVGLGILAAIALSAGCEDDGAPADASMSVDAGPCGPGEVEGPGGNCFMRIVCPDTIPTFRIGLEAAGDEGLYKVVIVDAMPSTPRQFVNRWIVDIVDLDDVPVASVTVDDVRPFMPAHGHDGLREPVIEAKEEAGRFDVDVINLWMPGPWTVTFDVTGPDGSDSMVFDVCI